MAGRRLLWALILPGFALAQTPQAAPPKSKPDVIVAGPQSPEWQKLGVLDKLRYDARHFIDPEHAVYGAMGAALDQVRDRPSEWGEGWGGYGDRLASHLGQYAIQRSIAFPVQAIDHEDPRYFRSTKTSFGGRVGDAFLHTIWHHDDTGGMMPAYSEFFGDYGAAAVSRYLWWPPRFRNGTAIFIAGSDTILIDSTINLLHEFAPDIKRRLHLGK